MRIRAHRLESPDVQRQCMADIRKDWGYATMLVWTFTINQLLPV